MEFTTGTPVNLAVAIRQSPCQISFVGMDAVEAARVEVRAWLPRLGVLTESLTSAHVLIEATDERRQQRLYRVRMDLTMAGGTVVEVPLDHPSNVAHEDLYVAIRNAFRAARRQLENYLETHPLVEATVEPLSSGPDRAAPSAPGGILSTDDALAANNPNQLQTCGNAEQR